MGQLARPGHPVQPVQLDRGLGADQPGWRRAGPSDDLDCFVEGLARAATGPWSADRQPSAFGDQAGRGLGGLPPGPGSVRSISSRT